ncbi:MAG: hypothetical protein ACYSOK_08465, partial [Planctomycetota bacterium]
MKMKTAGIAVLSVFGLLCGGLIVNAVLDNPQRAEQLIGRVVPLTAEVDEAEAPADAPSEPVAEVITTAPVVYPQLAATSAAEQTVKLGALYDEIERTDDPEKYKFQVELTSKGAAIRYLISSEFEARGETADS